MTRRVFALVTVLWLRMHGVVVPPHPFPLPDWSNRPDQTEADATDDWPPH